MDGASRQEKLINEENLQFAFKMLDFDGDGFISLEEVSQRFTLFNNEDNND